MAHKSHCTEKKELDTTNNNRNNNQNLFVAREEYISTSRIFGGHHDAKSVQFSMIETVIPTLHINDMTLQEIESTWYSRCDIIHFRRDNTQKLPQWKTYRNLALDRTHQLEANTCRPQYPLPVSSSSSYSSSRHETITADDMMEKHSLPQQPQRKTERKNGIRIHVSKDVQHQHDACASTFPQKDNNHQTLFQQQVYQKQQQQQQQVYQQQKKQIFDELQHYHSGSLGTSTRTKKQRRQQHQHRIRQEKMLHNIAVVHHVDTAFDNMFDNIDAVFDGIEGKKHHRKQFNTTAPCRAA